MMWSTLLIMVIILTLLGLIMFQVFGSFAINEKAESLISSAENIADYTAYWHAQNHHFNSMNVYNATLNAICDITDTDIIVANADGYVFASNMPAKKLPVRISSNYMDDALSGSVSRFTGTFDGCFSEKVLTIAYPISYEAILSASFLRTHPCQICTAA